MEDLEEIYNMIVASPDKSLDISITPESAIHSPSAPPHSSSSSCLSPFSAGMLPGKILRRWRASLFDWLAAEGGGVATTPQYISFVAGLFGVEQLAKEGRQAGEVTRLLISRTIAWKKQPELLATDLSNGTFQ